MIGPPALLTKHGRPAAILRFLPGPAAHSLYLLFTPSLCTGDPWRTLQAALRGGVDLVQWRPKRDDPDGAARCIEVCRGHGVPVIVNDDVALAARLGAAGAHVGQSDMPPSEARRLLRAGQWLGVSTHDLDEIRRALAGGADHLGFGPMFPTATKGYDVGQPAGALSRALAEAGPVPIFAIGGIGPANVARIVAEGCRRIAVGSAVLGDPSPEQVARSLRDALAD